MLNYSYKEANKESLRAIFGSNLDVALEYGMNVIIWKRMQPCGRQALYLVEYNNPYEWSFLSPDLLSSLRLLFLDPSPGCKTQHINRNTDEKWHHIFP